MVNYIILYKKFVEHHVIKLIILKILKILDIFNKINLITWCSTNFLYKITDIYLKTLSLIHHNLNMVMELYIYEDLMPFFNF